MGQVCLLDREMTGATRKMRPIIKAVWGRRRKNPGLSRERGRPGSVGSA